MRTSSTTGTAPDGASADSSIEHAPEVSKMGGAGRDSSAFGRLVRTQHRERHMGPCRRRGLGGWHGPE